jgi:hypothetical protein
MRIRLLQLSMVILGLMFLLPAFGKNKKNDNQPNTASATISSVDVAASTVTLEIVTPGKTGTSQEVVYKIDLGTTITIDGNSATLDQIHKGQKVNSYVEGDENALSSLDVKS